mmetsp:Transcript_47931/g.158855  ORF Transcript_47931/g.158855 Transcript_47931/m.158855 type:complete len:351 (-) Transcript_47931:59-1111(-)
MPPILPSPHGIAATHINYCGGVTQNVVCSKGPKRIQVSTRGAARRPAPRIGRLRVVLRLCPRRQTPRPYAPLGRKGRASLAQGELAQRIARVDAAEGLPSCPRRRRGHRGGPRDGASLVADIVLPLPGGEVLDAARRPLADVPQYGVREPELEHLDGARPVDDVRLGGGVQVDAVHLAGDGERSLGLRLHCVCARVVLVPESAKPVQRDAAHVGDAKVGVQRGGEGEGFGASVEDGERHRDGGGAVERDRVLQLEGLREEAPRLVVVHQLEHDARVWLRGGAQHSPLIRGAHEAVLRKSTAPGELRPADGHAAADGLAAAVLGGGGDKEALGAAADPRGEVGGVDVDERG